MFLSFFCAFIIFLFALLVFLFFKLNLDASVELITFFTFLAGTISGVLIYSQGIALTPVDLTIFSSSLFIIYLYFLVSELRKKEIEVPKEVKKAIKEIKKNKKKVKKNLIKEKDLTEYLDLKMEFEKGNAKNKNFQNKYKKIYRMKISGFGDDFYKKYFKLLSEKITDPEIVLRELSKVKVKGKRRVHLAFTTKLIHIVDPTLPLYSSMISEIFNLSIGNGTLEDRTKKAIQAYGQLCDYYRIMLKDDSITSLIFKVRERRDWKEGVVSDVKILDMIIKEAFDS